MTMHKRMAEVLDEVIEKIKDIKYRKTTKRPIWPMIILRTPKGWTGPKEVDGIKVEGNYAAHQVPLPNAKTDENQLKMLEKWLQSYNFKELYHEFAFED